MHIPFKALVVSLSLASFSASASVTKDPVKAITAATSWSEVIAQVEGRFPKLIADELRAATKDLPFPTIRSYRGQLVVTDAAGGRMTLAFGKDGTALLNGKPLHIRPLATVDAEVKRLAAGGEKSVSLLQYLIPDAQAAGLIGSGMAALAFSGSNAWKADACAEEDLSDELTQTCPLMGVGMVQLASAREATERSKKPYKPISLKCPNVNGGTLEIIKKNEDGLTVRNTYKYKDGQVTFMLIEAAEPGKKFEVLKKIDVMQPADDEARGMVTSGLNAITPVNEKVCNGSSENQSRFSAMLDSNRKLLMSPVKQEAELRSSSMDVN